MTLMEITAQLQSRGTRWFGKYGTVAISDGTVIVYKSRKEVYRGKAEEAAAFIMDKVYPSSAQVERQRTRSGGKYAKYEMRCEFCNAGLSSSTYETIEFEEDGQPYPVCLPCLRKHEAGKLSL